MLTRRMFCSVVVGITALSAAASAGQLNVVSLSPARHSISVDLRPTIDITFDLALDPATVTTSSVRVFGRNTGVIGGSRTLVNGGTTLRIVSDRRLIAGDVVTVTLARTIAATDGSPLRSAGFQYQFSAPVAAANRQFFLHQDWNVEAFPGEFPRIYGGAAMDLNADSLVDIAVICENSADIRVYANLPGNPGTFGPRILPSATTGLVPSPNDPADFNGDGKFDLCTGNYTSDDVTILLGNGDGRFGTRQDVAVTGTARGIQAQDYDGDGDPDIVCAVPGANKLALMINDGTGNFGSATLFEGGGNTEYGLSAADMDNDGIFDLVVGNENSQTITVLRGLGGGAFQLSNIRNAGGSPWVLVTGDVNGDGNLDVAVSNSFTANAGILRGNGNGTLQASTTYGVAGHTPAVELADFDGDRDLDMIVTSFGGNRWTTFINNGAGVFAFERNFTSPTNPGCAVATDVNNDRATDLILLDETGNRVRIYWNVSLSVAGDMNCDGVLTVGDIGPFVLALTNPGQYLISFPNCDLLAGDMNNDGQVSVSDIGAFVALLAGG